jgi:hypothetical protein
VLQCKLHGVVATREQATERLKVCVLARELRTRIYSCTASSNQETYGMLALTLAMCCRLYSDLVVPLSDIACARLMRIWFSVVGFPLCMARFISRYYLPGCGVDDGSYMCCKHIGVSTIR